MDSDSGEQSEGEPVTAAGREGATLPGGLGLERRGDQCRKSRVFLGAAGQEAGPLAAQDLSDQNWELVLGRPLTPWHLGASEGQEGHLPMDHTVAGSPAAALRLTTGAGGGGGSRNLRLVVFCRNRRNPLEVTFRVLPGPPSWGCEAVPQSRWEEKTRGQGYWLLARLVSAVLETAGQAGTEVLAQPCGVARGGGPRMRGLKQSRRQAELVFPFKRRHKLFIINSYGSNRIGGCSLGEK